MSDLKVQRLILGKGVIGSYIADHFEKEKIDFAIMDIGNEIEALTRATSTTSNINSNLATYRNSFTSHKGMLWGRGLMMIPRSEYLESKMPIDFESYKKSVNEICRKFLGKNLKSLEIYESDGNKFIDTLCIPPKIHDKFFYKLRDSKSNIGEYAAILISPRNSGYKVTAVNPSTGKVIEIHTKEILITLGALESVRLLLNSKELFDKNMTNIGRNLSDHVSMATTSVSTSRIFAMHNLSPRKKRIRKHPRFYHDPMRESELGGFSFIDYNPNQSRSSYRERTLRKVTRQELCPGGSLAKTLLETDKTDGAFMELRAGSETTIPQLHLEFKVSDKFLGEFEVAANQFLEYLSSRDIKFSSRANVNSIDLKNMFDSLHPTGVIPFTNAQEVGSFGADFQLYNHPGIYCFSTGILPRAFSVQPTLTIMAFAEIYLNNFFEKEKN